MSLQAVRSPVSLVYSHVGVYAGYTARRPFIEVEIAATSRGLLAGRPVRTTVLVDSGADITMLDEGLASALGVDLTSCPVSQCGGIGGDVDVRSAAVKILICGRWVDVPVFFAPNQTTQLLGREGAFEAVRFAFLHQHGLLLAAV